MSTQKACLVINPRDGQNVAKLTAILAVLEAAGWRTDVELKEYGGHSMELATSAARQGYDTVIAYGGDGTINQVVNGAMNGKKKKRSVVAVIPGGTVNQWAAEVGIPSDPVKAALAFVSSDARKVDIAHVAAASLTFLSPKQGDEDHPSNADAPGNIAQVRKVKTSAKKAKHHFLLMAGLGVDAAVMGQVNKSLKHSIGVASVGLAAVEKMPEQHTFPVEIGITGNGNEPEKLWQGDALQVVIGNTRRYANLVEMTSEASMVDGMLDVCVIQAGDPFSTMQQITSLLLRRKPDNRTTQFFRGAHLSIRVPASIDLQIDGSAVKLKDYVSKADYEELQHAKDKDHVLVTYQFDALPHALEVAIPPTYHGPLFEEPQDQDEQPSEQHQQNDTASADEKQHDADAPEETQHDTSSQGEQQQPHEISPVLLEHGRKVTVFGVAAQAGKKCAFVIAGTTSKSTGEIIPVAISIDARTALMRQNGEAAIPAEVGKLQEGAEIVVEGKKSKREVIHATRLVV